MIKNSHPYILCNGNAAQAIHLYENALGAKTENLVHYGDVPGACSSADSKPLILNACLRIGEHRLMVSDCSPGNPMPREGNVQIVLDFGKPADMAKAFEALSAGGQVTQPLHDAFWGAKFGTLTDAHGVRWMFNCQLNKN